MTILEMSLSAAVLILAIVMIRALTLHRLPKKTFLILWGVALCRLLIPIAVPSRFSLYTFLDMLLNKDLGIDTPFIVMEAGRAGVVFTDVVSELFSPLVLAWVIGTLACALFFLATHLRCRREYKTALPIDNEFITQWLSEHPIKRKVEIRQSDKIDVPLTYGIFRPVVLLPKATDWADETTLRYILTHEFVHIRCFDTLIKLLLAAAACVHWFNPFVWVMYVLFNRDIELSCDETVVWIFGETVKSAYALTLIGLEEKKSRLAPLVNNFSKNAIEERIVSIMKVKKSSILNTILAFGLVISLVTVFATSAMASAPFAEAIPSENASNVFIYTEAFGVDRQAIISSGTTSLIPLEVGVNDINGAVEVEKEIEIQEPFFIAPEAVQSEAEIEYIE